MSEHQVRFDLEQKIIQKEWEVDTPFEDLSWLHSEALAGLLSAWYELVRYYESNADDAVISVESMRSYVHFTRLLRNILLNPEIDIRDHEKAEEILTSFEGILENIIREVVSYQDTSRYQQNS